MTSPNVTQPDRMGAFVVGYRIMDSRTARESAKVAGTGTCKLKQKRTKREEKNDDW